MKRSKILNIIADIVHETRRATKAWTSDDIAEKILNDLEESGLAVVGQMYTLNNKIVYEVLTWEDENEKK